MALTLAQLAASDPAVLAHLTNGGVASRPAAEKVTLFAEAAAVLLVCKPSSSSFSALLAVCASVRSCTLPAQQVAASAYPQAHSNGQHWHIADQAMTCQQRAPNICPPAVLSAFNTAPFLTNMLNRLRPLTPPPCTPCHRAPCRRMAWWETALPKRFSSLDVSRRWESTQTTREGEVFSWL